MHAQSLECSNSISKFINILDDEIYILKNGDVQQLLEHYEKYNYASEFNKNHPKQIFLAGEWIDEKLHAVKSNGLITKFKTKELTVKNTILHPIKGNKIISDIEICVIPLEVTLLINEEEETVISDWILV